MSNRIDIGNVRGIRGEKGEKGEKGSKPTYDDLRYAKENGEFVAIKGTGNITLHYIDNEGNLCDAQGHLLDNNGNATNTVGTPFDENEYGYSYKPVWIDEEGQFTNQNGDLVDEYGNVQYVLSTFITDLLKGLYKDKDGYSTLVTDIYPNVVQTLISADPNDEDFRAFFDELEGDIKYYICEDDPERTIYMDNGSLVNTCKYKDENGNLVMINNSRYATVPLEKNALYLYNNHGLNDNAMMHYDIYLCTKANTVPKKLVSSADFVIDYNVIDDMGIETQNNDVNDEYDLDVWLKLYTRGTRGQFYSMSDVDTLFENNLISKIGANNGIAQLNSSGKVPSSQLPAYVDDIIEGKMNSAGTTFTPSESIYIDSVKQTGKIYVDTSTRKTYRWTGSAYVIVSNPIGVDDNSSLAFSSTEGQTLKTQMGTATLTTDSQTVTGAINEHETQINGLSSSLSNKVDKVSGKGLSTNDFTNTLKNKLDGISTGATKVVVDANMSSTSTNPVQNKAVKSYIDSSFVSAEDVNQIIEGNINALDLAGYVQLGDAIFDSYADVNHTHTNLETGTIAENDDLNDTSKYIDEGIYLCTTTSRAKTISHHPLSSDGNPTDDAKAFGLVVLPQKNFCRQIVYNNYSSTTGQGNRVWTRNLYHDTVNNTDTWSDWFEIYGTHNLNNATSSVDGLMSSVDKKQLNDLPYYGLNYTNSSSTTSDFTVTINKSGFDTLKHGMIITLLNYKADNVDNATLNVNNLGAKPIYYLNRKIKANEFPYKSLSLFMYSTWTSYENGTGVWIMITSPTVTEYDTVVTNNSSNLVTSGGVYDAIHSLDIPIANTDSNNILKDGTANAGSLNTYAKADHVHPINTQIPSNADLNEYYIEGFYYHPSTTNSKTILNYPGAEYNQTYSQANAFTLLVEKMSTHSVKQTLTQYTTSGNPRTFIRLRKADDTWIDWQEISYNNHTHSYEVLTNKPTIPQPNTDTSNILMNGTANAGSLNTYAKADHVHPINKEIPVNDDLNNYNIMGFYYCLTNTNAKTIHHYPTGLAENDYVDSSGAKAFTLLVEKLTSTGVKQTLTNYANTTDDNVKTWIRTSVSNSSWTSWRELEYKGHSHTTDDVSGLSSVAISGNYNDLSNKPQIDTTSGGTISSSKLISSGAVYDGLNGKSNINHSHNKKWKLILCEEDGIKYFNNGSHENTSWASNPYLNDYCVYLFYNEVIGICYLMYYREFGSLGTGNEFLGDNDDETVWTHFRNWIPKEYRPIHQVQGSFNYMGNLIVTVNGSILARFGEQASNPGVRGTCMWMPNKDVDKNQVTDMIIGFNSGSHLDNMADFE